MQMFLAAIDQLERSAFQRTVAATLLGARGGPDALRDALK
jgi:hypothetical protein